MMSKLLVVLTVFGVYGAVHAQVSYSDDFYKIESVEVEELSVSQEEIITETLNKENLSFDSFALNKGEGSDTVQQVREVIAVANEVIAFGEKVYKIVEKGRPVLNVGSEAVSVLPKTEENKMEARDLSGWSAPTVKKYRIAMRNFYNVEVASLTLMLVYSHGGTHNGSGQYITDAQIKPVELNLLWGYKMDVSFKVQSITNTGTSEDPIAAAVLMLDYSVSTVLQTRTGTRSYFITGAGETRVL